MEEILLGLLYAIAEAVLETFLEIVGEAVIALVSRAVGEVFAASRVVNPVLSALGYLILGGASGLLSVFLFPHRLVPQSRVHGVSLLVSPLITGFVMSRVGLSLRRQGQQATQIESFGYGFIFAFGMALVRFVFVK